MSQKPVNNLEAMLVEMNKIDNQIQELRKKKIYLRDQYHQLSRELEELKSRERQKG